MESKVICIEEHEKIIKEIKAEAENKVEKGFEEAYQMVKKAETQLVAQRNKSDLFCAIAYLEKSCRIPALAEFQSQIRPIIDILWSRTETREAKQAVRSAKPFGESTGVPPSTITSGHIVNETISSTNRWLV